MADQKISALTADTAPSIDDLIVTVNDPAGTPANKKVTLGDVLALGSPLLRFTSPALTTFAWVNQGSATVDTTNNWEFLQGTLASGPSMRLRIETAPATPWTRTALFLPRLTTSNFSGAGLCFREASGGKIVTFNLSGDTQTITIGKWNSPTSFSAVYSGATVTAGYRFFGGMPYAFRVADDGTDRIRSISMDGVHFVAVHTIGRTDFLGVGADGVGIFVTDQNVTYAPALTLLSWV